MPDKPWVYGATVENGGTPAARLRYLSCSTIEKCDASSNKSPGCLRKWFYEKVLRWKAEERTFAALGKQCHDEIDRYLTTGDNVLGRITTAAKRYMPAPDPERNRLLVEYDLGRRDPTLATAALHCAGVPMVGYVDLMHAEPAINLEGDGVFNDPAGTVEILDWKFGAAKRDAPRGGQGGYFGKEARDLPVDTQMVTYANWFHNATKSTAPTERLSHVYTNTKGRPEAHKVSILVEHEAVARRWEYIESVGRTIVDVVRESDVEKVPANTLACESFGGCPYAEQCTARKFNSLDSFWGPGTLEGAAIAGALQLSPAPDEGNVDMGLIDALNLPAAPVATPAPAMPPIVTVSPSGVAANLSIGAMMAGLGAPSAPAAPPAWTPEFQKAVNTINGKGYGFPTLIGRAATMLANMSGTWGAAVPETLPGFGQMARVDAIEDPAVLIAAATDMAGVPNNPTPDVRPMTATPAPAAPIAVAAPVAPPVASPMGILPADAPVSNPALAAVVPPGVTLPAAVTAPVVAPSAPVVNAPTEVAAAPAEAPARKKRGPNKPKPATDAPASAEPVGTDTANGPEGSWLFVNAIPSIAYENLQTQIDTWAVGLARHYKIEPADIRCGSDDSATGFGKWKGLMTTVARRAAPTLKAGAWYLDLRDSEINRAVFEGLRSARFTNPDGTDGDLVFDLVVRGHA